MYETVQRILSLRVIIKRTLYTISRKPSFSRILVIEWSPAATNTMIYETYGNLGKNKKFYTIIHEEIIPHRNVDKREKELRELYRTELRNNIK